MSGESKRPRSSISEIILAVVSIGAVCLYVTTIFIQFGYNSYFSIPSEFISFSIRENTLFFRLLVEAFLLFLASIKWWWILVVSIIIGGYFYAKIRKLIGLAVIVFVGLFMWRTISLGELIAQNQSTFFVLADDCTAMGTSTTYFIPNFYDGKALLVPYTKEQSDTKKIGSGFIVRDLSELPCRVVYNYHFGKVEK
jgi:hypothetical protein